MAKTTQTHNNITVLANSYAPVSAWFECDQYDKISISMTCDASTTNKAEIEWSHDGQNRLGSETVLASSAGGARSSSALDVKARYFRVYIKNEDTAQHVMSSWAYLKP